jgi:hypothetical protein
MRTSLLLGALVAVVVTAANVGCASGDDEKSAPEAAQDLRGQVVPGVGVVKRAQCVNPPLRCAVNSAQGQAAVCAVSGSTQDGYSCDDPEPVDLGQAMKTCTQWEDENFEPVGGGPSGLEFECAMARKLGKLKPGP